MLPKCSKCSAKISLSWFISAFGWTKYRCVNCGVKHKFTGRHVFVVALMPVLIIGGFEILPDSIESFSYRLLIPALISLSALILIPGQHEIYSSDEPRK